MVRTSLAVESNNYPPTKIDGNNFTTHRLRHLSYICKLRVHTLYVESYHKIREGGKGNTTDQFIGIFLGGGRGRGTQGVMT